MNCKQANVSGKILFCLILFFLGLMSASVTHAETYTFVTKWTFSDIQGHMSPFDVAVDSSGNVYVADTSNRIDKFSSSNGMEYTLVKKWGSYGTGDGQLYNPQGIAVDSSGNVYIADTEHHRIQKFDSNGNFIKYVGDDTQARTRLPGGDPGQFNYPRGIAVDSSGNVYVADTNNNRIQKFDSNGNYKGQWGSYALYYYPNSDGKFNYPWGIAVDSSGNVYVADTNNNRIQKFDSNGVFITKWGSGGRNEGQFEYPTGIDVDSMDNVYVVENSNNRIQKFSSSNGKDHTFITMFGNTGMNGAVGTGDGQLQHPIGIAVDSTGKFVYVADTGNRRIQKFAAETASIPEFPSITLPVATILGLIAICGRRKM